MIVPIAQQLLSVARLLRAAAEAYPGRAKRYRLAAAAAKEAAQLLQRELAFRWPFSGH